MDEQRSFSSFLRTSVMSIISLLFLLAAFNLVIDPFSIFLVVDWEGFNRIKPKRRKYRTIWKLATVEREKPAVIFLGDSRTEFGLDPDSETSQRFLGKHGRIFNCAVPNASIYEIERFARHAIETGNPTHFIIGLDLGQFNEKAIQASKDRLGEYEKMFSVDASGRPQPLHSLNLQTISLVTVDAFQASIATVSRQKNRHQRFSESGHKLNEVMMTRMLRSTSQADVFSSGEDRLIQLYQGISDHGPGMKHLASILVAAREHDIQLTLFIAPTHANTQYIRKLLHGYESMEKWKRDLVKLVECGEHIRNDIRREQANVRLFDFSIANEYTCEQPSTSRENQMRWHIDTFHFNARYGDLVMAAMFGKEISQTTAGTPIGYRLSSENLEESIALYRTRLEQHGEMQQERFIDLRRRIRERNRK